MAGTAGSISTGSRQRRQEATFGPARPVLAIDLTRRAIGWRDSFDAEARRPSRADRPRVLRSFTDQLDGH